MGLPFGVCVEPAVEIGLGNADGASLAAELDGREFAAADQVMNSDRGNVQPVGCFIDLSSR